MKKFRLKCGLELWYKNNELSQVRKEVKKAWNWSIDQVWGKFHKDKSESMRCILQDHYLPIVNYIESCISQVKFLGMFEDMDVTSAGGSCLFEDIDTFDKGGDEKFKSYCIPRIRRAMFDKVLSKVIKRRLGDHGEKITDQCLRSLPLGRPKKQSWPRNVALKSTGLIKKARIKKNYLCRKCEKLTQSSTKPKVLNCPEGRSHQWTNLGNVGDENYYCKKCDVVVQTSECPASFNCPIGGNHQWTDLGKVGDNDYCCDKCGAYVLSSEKPSSLNCSEGGSHKWAKVERCGKKT
jgi:hypothetical protein